MTRHAGRPRKDHIMTTGMMTRIAEVVDMMAASLDARTTGDRKDGMSNPQLQHQTLVLKTIRNTERATEEQETTQCRCWENMGACFP